MADGVSPGSRVHRIDAAQVAIGNAGIFANPAARYCAAHAFSAAASRTRRCAPDRMELLLVPQQEIPAGKASRALLAFEGFLLGMRSLVSFQVFQSCERTSAGTADMRSRLVGLGRRKLAIRAILCCTLSTRRRTRCQGQRRAYCGARFTLPHLPPELSLTFVTSMFEPGDSASRSVLAAVSGCMLYQIQVSSTFAPCAISCFALWRLAGKSSTCRSCAIQCSSPSNTKSTGSASHEVFSLD